MATIRRRNGFSDRNNIKPINKTMQFLDFEAGTRICIYNHLCKMIDAMCDILHYKSDGQDFVAEYCCANLFNIPIDSRSCYYDNVVRLIKQTIEENQYDDVLDVIEFVCIDLLNAIIEKSERYYLREEFHFKEIINKLFEEEYVGYRFVNDIIIPITNNDEINAIEDASSTPYKKVNQSIVKASLYLSAKNKDYENSSKESITAVETLCAIVVGKDNSTLGQMINEIEKKKKIHPALKDSISKLYGFASDVPGIRHGGNKTNNCITFSEAKFVLLICSSIINFFIENVI